MSVELFIVYSLGAVVVYFICVAFLILFISLICKIDFTYADDTDFVLLVCLAQFLIALIGILNYISKLGGSK